MKKVIQILLIAILSVILLLAVIFIFNPLNSRTKLISSVINTYLSNTFEDYTPLADNQDGVVNSINEQSGKDEVKNDKHPMLNEEQEKKLESLGVDVESLPSSITPGMETCFVEKLGQERVNEIVGGVSPSPIEIFKTRECLNN